MLVGNRIVLRNISEKDFNSFFQFHNSDFVLKYNCMHLMSEQNVKDYIAKFRQNDSMSECAFGENKASIQLFNLDLFVKVR